MSRSERQALKAMLVTVLLLLAASTLLFAQSQPRVITRTFDPDPDRPLRVMIRGDGAEVKLENVSRSDQGRARYRYHEDHFSGTLDWESERNTFEVTLEMEVSSFDTDDETQESELEVLLPGRPEIDLDVTLKAGVISLDGDGLTFDALDLSLWAGELNASFPTRSDRVINRVEADVKLGEMRLENLGNLAFEELNVNGFAGEVVLDFSGEVSMRREARVDLEIGTVTVIVPKGMTVRSRISKLGFLAQVDVPRAWRKDGRYFYSPGASRREADLMLDIRGGIGEITIVER